MHYPFSVRVGSRDHLFSAQGTSLPFGSVLTFAEPVKDGTERDAVVAAIVGDRALVERLGLGARQGVEDWPDDRSLILA